MNQGIIEALKQIEAEKGIPREKLLPVVESALVSAYKKSFGVGCEVNVNIDEGTGEIKIALVKIVVSKVEDTKKEISKKEAKKLGFEKVKVKDKVEIEVTSPEFGRIAAQTAKQVVLQKIRNEEKELIYEEFKDKEREIITGIIQRKLHRNVFIDLGKIEALLPFPEQVFKERYQQGERIKVYVVEVRKTNHGPQIIVSRAHPKFPVRLLEGEIPEIAAGTIEIKSFAREPGIRSKIAVASKEGDIEPVGACVGIRGSRIQMVIKELKGERIDIVRWNENPSVYLSNALNPAQIVKTTLNEERKAAEVIVPDDQLSLAIGKGGQNVKLAARLTGWKIDLRSESQIAERENVPLPKLSGIGPKTLKCLEEHGFRRLEKLAKAEISTLISIPGIGKKTAEKIILTAKQANATNSI